MIVRCKKHIQCFKQRSLRPNPRKIPYASFNPHAPPSLPSFLFVLRLALQPEKRFDGYSSKGAKDWCRRGPYRYRGPVHLRLRGVQPSSEQQTCARLWDPQIFRYKAITNVRYIEHIQCILHHPSSTSFSSSSLMQNPPLEKWLLVSTPAPFSLHFAHTLV